MYIYAYKVCQDMMFLIPEASIGLSKLIKIDDIIVIKGIISNKPVNVLFMVPPDKILYSVFVNECLLCFEVEVEEIKWNKLYLNKLWQIFDEYHESAWISCKEIHLWKFKFFFMILYDTKPSCQRYGIAGTHS